MANPRGPRHGLGRCRLLRGCRTPTPLRPGRDVWLDTAYTLGHLPDDEFVDFVRIHGAERILWGSDGPWTDASRELTHLRSLRLREVELDAITRANAERLLRL